MAQPERIDFRSRRTLEATERLRETMRLVLTLREYEGINLEEAALLLDVTEDELEKLHADALEQLEALLAADAEPY